MKNIVVCSDGTGNTANKGRGTNVFKLYESVDTREKRKSESKRDKELGPKRDQVAIYCDGVGTDKLKFLRAIGGAFGFGFSRNVRRLYTQILQVYEPGDQIYMFGFSRGAYTARVLAGLIGECGLPSRKSFPDPNKKGKDKEIRKFASEAYSAYRGKYRAFLAPLWDLLAVHRWRRRNLEQLKAFTGSLAQSNTTNGMPATSAAPPIAMVGVWDTVDAVGFPVVGLATLWDRVVHGFMFRERGLNESVACARHALSLDDERRTFHPRLWRQDARIEDRIRQVWFAGVHSNVGGGYPKHGVSHRPLAWMMHEAHQKGLDFLPGKLEEYGRAVNIDDHIYDSRAGLGVYYRYAPRDVKKLCDQSSTTPLIDISVVDRLKDSPQGYAPGAWPREAEVVDAVKWKRYEEPERAIQDALDKDESPQAGVNDMVVFRKVVQWVMLGGTVLLLAFLAGTAEFPRDTKSAFVKFWDGWTMGDVLVRIGLPLTAVAYLLGLFSRTKIESHLERFWRPTREDLDRGDASPMKFTSSADESDEGQNESAEATDSESAGAVQWSSPWHHAFAALVLLFLVFVGGFAAMNWYAATPGTKAAHGEVTPKPYSQRSGYSYKCAREYLRKLANIKEVKVEASTESEPRADGQQAEPKEVIKERSGLCSYRRMLVADNIFAPLYGVAFLIVLARALQLIGAARVTKTWLRTACLLTIALVVVVVVADFFENDIWLEQVDRIVDDTKLSDEQLDHVLSRNRLVLASLATVVKLWGLIVAGLATVALTYLTHRMLLRTGSKSPVGPVPVTNGGPGDPVAAEPTDTTTDSDDATAQ